MLKSSLERKNISEEKMGFPNLNRNSTTWYGPAILLSWIKNIKMELKLLCKIKSQKTIDILNGSLIILLIELGQEQGDTEDEQIFAQ